MSLNQSKFELGISREVPTKAQIIKAARAIRSGLRFTRSSPYLGCHVGTIITMPLSGMLTKYGFDGGWASVFYCFGEFV